MNEIGSDGVYFFDAEALPPGSSEFSPDERRILDLVNRKVAAGRSLDDVMGFVFETTREILPSDRLGLSFVEEDGRRVVARWARASYEPLLLGDGFAQDLRGSTLAPILDGAHTRVITDLGRYLDAHPHSASTRLVVQEGLKSSMTCPLSVDGRPVGFLFRSSRQPNAYDHHHVRLHLAIAERLSQAVEKAWRIEQLAAANQAYFEMLGFVSHELKSPIASLVMDVETILCGYEGEVTPGQSRKLQKVVEKSQYLLGLIGEYFTLSRIEGGQFEANIQSDVDFTGDVLGGALDIVQAQIVEKGITLHREWPDELVRVEGDPGLLRILLVNLLDNAVKYGVRDGEIRLRVERTDDKLTLSVWNKGPGFPPDQKPRLFRRFSRLQTPELLKRKGTGLGLYAVWRIVHLHGGSVWAESAPGEWAEFVVEIPQPIPRVNGVFERRPTNGGGSK